VNELQVSCEGRQYHFGQGQTVRIGRSTDNDVVVSDPTVSRQHARLAWDSDKWVFEGLGRAGTYLRGSVVTRLPLAEPVELALASPHGPVVRLEPPRSASPAGTADEGTPAGERGRACRSRGSGSGRDAGPRCRGPARGRPIPGRGGSRCRGPARGRPIPGRPVPNVRDAAQPGAAAPR
jgi:hypothetical protein